MTGPLLSVSNLRTTFTTEQETIRAVDGVSFAVHPRQTLGIVGESGSGKSVTARSILGLIDEPGRVHPDSAIRYHRPAFVQRIAREYPDRVRWVDGDDGDGDEDGDGADRDGSHDGDAFVTIEAGDGEGSSVTVDRRQPAPGAVGDPPRPVGRVRHGDGRRPAGERRHPGPEGPARRVPPPVLRRDAAARDHRAGAGLRPVGAALRRADDGA
ncbi:MAG: hypothetical protein BRD21_08260 [Halobacteriales archaeon SW_8_66_22]|nr:MAG: hypothetical protein BRD21_08260 [Halobacteriales archaeon SW_8_66_22]